jgi:hypothetical protein
MKRINQFLHSEASVLLVLALALLAQTPHTATVFHRLATGTDGLNWLAWLHAVFYAVSLEFATLLFVARGNRRLAWTFAIVSVLANAAYYWHDNMTAAYMASAALISLALPACIAFYSHNVAVSKTVKLPSDDTDTTPPALDLLPPTVKRRKPKTKSGAVADGVLALEEMLDGVIWTVCRVTQCPKLGVAYMRRLIQKAQPTLGRRRRLANPRARCNGHGWKGIGNNNFLHLTIANQREPGQHMAGFFAAT